MAVEAIRTSLRPPRFVSEADLERELVIVRDLAAESCAGVFGPSSMMWRIDKEAAIFLGAGRALLLQLAHPWIAAAIAQHSPVLTDPIGRFHRTFKVMFTIVFGTTEQGLAAARRL
ncbi:MAG TPA: oxygenase MpaB family protein, partial [Stellaceae bacterium]|nr:oxygenase MpaB family protein [Stellaceae bacterium]